MTILSAAEREGIKESLYGVARNLSAGEDASQLISNFGWDELCIADMSTAVSVVFELLGRTGATANMFDDLVVRVFAEASHLKATAVVVPPKGVSTAAAAKRSADTVKVDGMLLGTSATAIVVALSDSGLALLSGDNLEITKVVGIDPTLGLSRIRGVTEPIHTLTSNRDLHGWNELVRWGRIALAFQLVGGAAVSLELAISHAKQREQFGHPIGTFQAVQHRLAEVFVGIEAARAGLDGALISGDPLAAMVAKSLAGRAARIAASGCLQVLGGIGFTAEHDYHHFHLRSLVLDRLLGSAEELPRLIGTELLACQSVPRFGEL